MKTQISRMSYDPTKRYSGVYQQMGRILNEADGNELVEILKSKLDDALKDVVGEGTPRHRKLEIKIESGEWKIKPGYVYVDGISAHIPGDTNTLIPYVKQPDLQDPQSISGDCVIYADVWERSLTALQDVDLMDSALNGMDTCTRTRTMLQIKWCASEDKFASCPKKGNAELTVSINNGNTTAPDPCDPCAAQVELDSRIGNYLFRVEVHDVVGDASNPTGITLKWSSENGAEQCASRDEAGNAIPLPAGFNDGKRVFEFFNEKTEQRAGVFLDGSYTQRPAIQYPYPGQPVSSMDFVRRWDGYCILAKDGNDNWSVTKGYDKDIGDLSKVSVPDKFEISPGIIKFTLNIKGKEFIAGDYWMVPIREREIQAELAKKAANQSYAIPQLLNSAPPHGIEHHYLKLATIKNGSLADNPEKDRRYAFPPLTEMTRIFSAGGDGQVGMPRRMLPQPLRIGVANGEWPVRGATVRFSIDSGAGSLSPADGVVRTDSDGIAECRWTLGDDGKPPRVKVTLVHPETSENDFKPPVYFYAHIINADEVVYKDPGCGNEKEPSVRWLLSNDNDVHWPSLDKDGHTTVKDILDALLCEFNATHLPLDKSDSATLCDDLKSDKGIQTVQDAINALCGGGCAVTVGKGGQFEKLQDALERLNKRPDRSICICLLPQLEPYVIEDTLRIIEKLSIKITGCGAAATRVRVNGLFLLSGLEVVLRDVAFDIKDGENVCVAIQSPDNLSQIAHSHQSIKSNVTIENCSFSRTSDSNLFPIVALKGVMQLHWKGNTIKAQAGQLWEAKKEKLGKLLGDALNINKLSMLNKDPCLGSSKINVVALKWAEATIAYFNNKDIINPWQEKIAAFSKQEKIDQKLAAYLQELSAIFSGSLKINTTALSEVFKKIAIWLFSPPDALSLDGGVCGWITDSQIVGNVVLFGDVTPNNEFYCWDWETESQQKLLSQLKSLTQSALELRGNDLTAVHCRIPQPEVTDKAAVINCYSSLSLRDNIFQRPSSIFVGQYVNVSGNQFNGVPTGGGIVAHAFGSSGIVMGNQANQPKNETEMRCVFEKGAIAEAANLLTIKT